MAFTRLRRVLVVGAGSMGCRHAANLRTLIPGVELGLVRSNPQLGENPAEFHKATTFTDLKAAIEWDPGAAIVASPAPFHLDAAVPLANAGVPLLIEKPLSHSMEGVVQLLDAVQATGTRVMVGYTLRFHPALQRLHDLVAESLGPIHKAEFRVGQHISHWRPGKDIADTVSLRADLGGGALLELSHEIDLARWFLGTADGVSGVRLSSELGAAVEDTVDVTLQHGEASAVVHMDMVSDPPFRTVRLQCAKGTAEWGGDANITWTSEEGGSESETFALNGRNDVYMREMETFLAVAEGKTTNPVSLAEAVDVLRIIDMVRAAGGA